MADPGWLTWTRELQAIAQTGLTFDHDPYDRERDKMLRTLPTCPARFSAATGLPF